MGRRQIKRKTRSSLPKLTKEKAEILTKISKPDSKDTTLPPLLDKTGQILRNSRHSKTFQNTLEYLGEKLVDGQYKVSEGSTRELLELKQEADETIQGMVNLRERMAEKQSYIQHRMIKAAQAADGLQKEFKSLEPHVQWLRAKTDEALKTCKSQRELHKELEAVILLKTKQLEMMEMKRDIMKQKSVEYGTYSDFMEAFVKIKDSPFTDVSNVLDRHQNLLANRKHQEQMMIELDAEKEDLKKNSNIKEMNLQTKSLQMKTQIQKAEAKHATIHQHNLLLQERLDRFEGKNRDKEGYLITAKLCIKSMCEQIAEMYGRVPLSTTTDMQPYLNCIKDYILHKQHLFQSGVMESASSSNVIRNVKRLKHSSRLESNPIETEMKDRISKKDTIKTSDVSNRGASCNKHFRSSQPPMSVTSSLRSSPSSCSPATPESSLSVDIRKTRPTWNASAQSHGHRQYPASVNKTWNRYAKHDTSKLQELCTFYIDSPKSIHHASSTTLAVSVNPRAWPDETHTKLALGAPHNISTALNRSKIVTSKIPLSPIFKPQPCSGNIPAQNAQIDTAQIRKPRTVTNVFSQSEKTKNKLDPRENQTEGIQSAPKMDTVTHDGQGTCIQPSSIIAYDSDENYEFNTSKIQPLDHLEENMPYANHVNTSPIDTEATLTPKMSISEDSLADTYETKAMAESAVNVPDSDIIKPTDRIDDTNLNKSIVKIPTYDGKTAKNPGREVTQSNTEQSNVAGRSVQTIADKSPNPPTNIQEPISILKKPSADEMPVAQLQMQQKLTSGGRENRQLVDTMKKEAQSSRQISKSASPAAIKTREEILQDLNLYYGQVDRPAAEQIKFLNIMTHNQKVQNKKLVKMTQTLQRQQGHPIDSVEPAFMGPQSTSGQNINSQDAKQTTATYTAFSQEEASAMVRNDLQKAVETDVIIQSQTKRKGVAKTTKIVQEQFGSPIVLHEPATTSAPITSVDKRNLDASKQIKAPSKTSSLPQQETSAMVKKDFQRANDYAQQATARYSTSTASTTASKSPINKNLQKANEVTKDVGLPKSNKKFTPVSKPIVRNNNTILKPANSKPANGKIETQKKHQ